MKQDLIDLRDKISGTKFKDADAALAFAQKEARGSRLAVYAALTAAFNFYIQSKGIAKYLEDKFKSHDPIIPYKTGGSFFTPIIKLVFGLTDSQYASRVSEYALALEYIDRLTKDQDFVDDIDNPAIGITIIQAIGGIKKAADEQRKHNNPRPNGVASIEDTNKFYREKCNEIYNTRDNFGSIDVEISTGEGDYVLMMGRVGSAGKVDVIEMMEMDSDTIIRLVKDKALEDVSSVPDTLNLFADSLGFLNVFRGNKDAPVISVDKGGDAINISMDNTKNASIIVTAKPKDPNLLSGFTQQAHLDDEGRNWFKKYAQEKADRHIYKIASEATKDAVIGFKLTNSINSESEILHFKSLTRETRKQVKLDPRLAINWPFSFMISYAKMANLYHNWLKDWARPIEFERKKAADRIITLTVNKNGLALTSSGSEDHHIQTNTGINDDEEYTFNIRGIEFVLVVDEILKNTNIDDIQIRGFGGGVFELQASDKIAEYTIDIPNLADGFINYEGKYFD